MDLASVWKIFCFSEVPYEENELCHSVYRDLVAPMLFPESQGYHVYILV